MANGKNRKMIAAALAVVVVAGVAVGGNAIVSAASREDAKKAALASVPEGVTLVEQDSDDGKYEFTFRTEDGSVEYEVEVSKSSGKVKEIHMSLRDDRGAEAATLSEADAIKAVEAAWAGASVTSIRLVRDDGRFLYEVRFEADDRYGTAEVHAETGVIVESDVKMGAPIVVPTTAPAGGTGETEAAVYLTTAQVKELALAKVPDGTVREVDFDRENGKYIYEVDLYKDGTKYELVYDAISGEELRCKTEADSWNAAPVTAESVKETKAAEKETKAAEKETKAAEKETKAAEKETKAAEKETKAAEQETKAAEQETKAAEKETKPVKETQAAKETQPETENLIGEEKAGSIALGKAKEGGAVISYIKLEKDDGRRVYEGEMRDNSYEYDFEIDAYTGTVIDWDVDRLERDDHDDWDD